MARATTNAFHSKKSSVNKNNVSSNSKDVLTVSAGKSKNVTTTKYSPKMNTYDIKISCAYNSRSPTNQEVNDST